MRGAAFSLAVAAAATTGLFSQHLALAAPVVAHAGSIEDIVISEHNTVNGTAPPAASDSNTQDVSAASVDTKGTDKMSHFIGTTMSSSSTTSSSSNTLKFAIHNNFAGTTRGLKAYVTGRDMSGAVVMLDSQGQWYHPNAGGSMIPVAIPLEANIGITMDTARGSTTEFTIPDFIESGRVYIADGDLVFSVVTSDLGGTTLVEPSAANPTDASAEVNWGFVELTNLADAGIFANISFVDFVGLVMAMKLTLGSGETQQVQGLDSDAVQAVCDAMRDQAARDGQPWDQMCVTDASGKALRIMAPNMYVADHPGSMDGYYAEYVDQVWQKYTGEDLVINTQSGAGQVACRVKETSSPGKQVLSCQGDNRDYVKPLASDIWGCNTGPFAIIQGDNDVHKAVVPRLCAAFTRTELLAEGGNVTPREGGSAAYYKADPTNHYSRIIHEHQVDGKGYAFSYDDVNPDGENAAGVVAGRDPKLLEIFVGGMVGGGNGSYTGPAGVQSMVTRRGREGAPIRRRLTRYDRFVMGMQ